MKRVAIFLSMPQAQAALMTLGAQGIRAHLDSSTDGLLLATSLAAGGIGLWVTDSQAGEAQDLLAELDPSIELVPFDD